MASELSWRHTATGSNLYVTIRSAARTMWNGAAMEALTVANWDNYDIALTETPESSYFYVGTWPAALAVVGWYWVDVFSRVGGSPAISDTLVGGVLGYWNGTTLSPWSADAATVGGATAEAIAVDENGYVTYNNSDALTDTTWTDAKAAYLNAAITSRGTGTSTLTTGDVDARLTAWGKAGFKLASDGLDSITATEPTAKPTNFRQWLMWLVQRFRRASSTKDALTVLTEAGETVTTQAIDATGNDKTLGAPTS